MRRIRRSYKRNSKFKTIFITHIQNNIKEYIVASLIFIIGVLLGVVFLNNLNNVQTDSINSYLTSSINSLKESQNLNEKIIIKEAITGNIKLVIFLWLMGSTVIGLLLVYLIVCFKGFTFGYTVSAIISVLGIGKGVVFVIATMLLKNIITIPCIIALAVSGMKLYKSIMQDRRKENIKIEIIRHTLFCVFILIILIASTFAESYITKFLLKYFINYI